MQRTRIRARRRRPFSLFGWIINILRSIAATFFFLCCLLGLAVMEQVNAIAGTSGDPNFKTVLIAVTIGTFTLLLFSVLLLSIENKLDNLALAATMFLVILVVGSNREKNATAGVLGFQLSEDHLLSDQVFSAMGNGIDKYLARTRSELHAIASFSRELKDSPEVVCSGFDESKWFDCYRSWTIEIARKSPLTVSGQLSLTALGRSVVDKMERRISHGPFYRKLPESEQSRYLATWSMDTIELALLNFEIILTRRLTASKLLGRSEKKDAKWGLWLSEFRDRRDYLEIWQRMVPLADNLAVAVIFDNLAKPDDSITKLFAKTNAWRGSFTPEQTSRFRALTAWHKRLIKTSYPLREQFALMK